MLGEGKACHMALGTLEPSAGDGAYPCSGYKTPLFTGTLGKGSSYSPDCGCKRWK